MSWLELETIFFDAARAATGLAANWLIQSTLLIAGGLAVGCILRKRGSAVQSAVYRTTLVAVLVPSRYIPRTVIVPVDVAFTWNAFAVPGITESC